MEIIGDRKKQIKKKYDILLEISYFNGLILHDHYNQYSL